MLLLDMFIINPLATMTEYSSVLTMYALNTATEYSSVIEHTINNLLRIDQ